MRRKFQVGDHVLFGGFAYQIDDIGRRTTIIAKLIDGAERCGDMPEWIRVKAAELWPHQIVWERTVWNAPDGSVRAAFIAAA